jgi:hypothetical protein
MSFSTICSPRALVAVETTTRSELAAAGMRYARDFPVPVPASTSRASPRSRARSTASVIWSCSLRAS